MDREVKRYPCSALICAGEAQGLRHLGRRWQGKKHHQGKKRKGQKREKKQAERWFWKKAYLGRERWSVDLTGASISPPWLPEANSSWHSTRMM